MHFANVKHCRFCVVCETEHISLSSVRYEFDILLENSTDTTHARASKTFSELFIKSLLKYFPILISINLRSGVNKFRIEKSIKNCFNWQWKWTDLLHCYLLNVSIFITNSIRLELVKHLMLKYFHSVFYVNLPSIFIWLQNWRFDSKCCSFPSNFPIRSQSKFESDNSLHRSHIVLQFSNLFS